MATGTDWKRLGDRVVSRRVALGMKTREELASRMDLSYRALSDLENGKRSFTAGTLAMVEQSLAWTPGSAQRILAGGEPALAGRDQTARPDEQTSPDDEASHAYLQLLREPIAALVAVKLIQSVMEADGIKPSSRLRDAIREAEDKTYRLAAPAFEALLAGGGGFDSGFREFVNREISEVITSHSAEIRAVTKEDPRAQPASASTPSPSPSPSPSSQSGASSEADEVEKTDRRLTAVKDDGLNDADQDPDVDNDPPPPPIEQEAELGIAARKTPDGYTKGTS